MRLYEGNSVPNQGDQHDMSADGKKPEPGKLHENGPVGPGERIGRFRIEKELGRGGMGVVYLARDVELNRVLLKNSKLFVFKDLCKLSE